MHNLGSINSYTKVQPTLNFGKAIFSSQTKIKRIKFMKISRLAINATLGAALALGFTGCATSLGDFTVASSNNVRNLNYSIENKTKTKTTTAIGPAAGSFMISRLRCLLPNPPTQASAQSAKPSRCNPPVSKTHSIKIITAWVCSGSVERHSVEKANKLPIIKPITG